jgi:Zn-dependent M28 family amino/carboxypeptidase
LNGEKNMRVVFAAAALMFVNACGGFKAQDQSIAPATNAAMTIEPSAIAAPAGPPLAPAAIAQHVRELASDAFEGRAPASEGETKTLNYLISQFAAAGLKPGFHGEWLQPVPLQESRVLGEPMLTISGGAQASAVSESFQYRRDHVIWTKRSQTDVALENAPLVFVGYGVVAPEHGWNDYAGQDMRGKVAVILINDPDFEADLGGKFEGKAMTYYGRWTYKFEEAARQGASGALIIHETAPAAYPWAVVQSSWTGVQFDVLRADGNRSRPGVEGWISTPMAGALFTRAGLDFAKAKAAAQRPGFAPIPMGISASTRLTTGVKQTISYNVIGVWEGRAAKGEALLYTAHWDHLGRCPPVDGDDICNGARDNATGTAGLIEIARRFGQEGRLNRNVYFVGFTAEEKGLLGSAHYAANPAVALNKTVAAINMDGVQTAGASHDIVIVGYGKSELDDLLGKAAAAQGRRTAPEAFPERGGFFRSDHFELAKVGVPAMFATAGIDLIVGGEARGRALSNAYIADAYHKPADEFDPSWDLVGASLDLQLLYTVGRDIAAGTAWPQWKAGAEFKATREQSLKR